MVTDVLTVALLSAIAIVASGQTFETVTFRGASPTLPSGLDPDTCGRAPPALREALLYTVARHDSNNDGIIDPTDLEWENILYSSGEGDEYCTGLPFCPVMCVTTRNEWANAWECFSGFDRGYALTVFKYLDINSLPGFAKGGDGAMLNRDLKARLNPAPVTVKQWRSILATLFRQYCSSNNNGKYCDQLSDIADF